MTALLAPARRAAAILRSTRGAFDMMSVLAGAAIVAILVAGTLTNAFGVIPWAQDNGAKRSLSAASTAQGVAEVRDGRFLDDAGLRGASYLSGTSSMAVGADADGSCWVGLARSDTGNVFYSTNEKSDPQTFVSGTNPGCVARTDLRKLAGVVGAPLPTAYAAGWGSSNVWASGTPSTNVPLAVKSSGALAGKSVTVVEAGSFHSCAVADEKAFCWGSNTSLGRLGTGTTSASTEPVAVDTSGALAGKSVTDISAGMTHSCAVADGQAFCWGGNANGQLGVGNTTTQLRPVAVEGLLSGKTVTAISVGHEHTCAIANEQVFCWGYNLYGRLGDGTSVTSYVPVPAIGALSGKSVSAISSGEAHTCALAGQAAYCWGFKSKRALGVNLTLSTTSPVAVDTSGALAGKAVTAISAGWEQTCAVADAAVFCWGQNDYGQLGTGSTIEAQYPVAVGGALSGKRIATVSAGDRASCAVAETGEAYCWGMGTSGQLGAGTNTTSLVPQPVSTSTVLAGKSVMGISTGSFFAVAFYE